MNEHQKCVCVCVFLLTEVKHGYGMVNKRGLGKIFIKEKQQQKNTRCFLLMLPTSTVEESTVKDLALQIASDFVQKRLMENSMLHQQKHPIQRFHSFWVMNFV